MAAVDSALAELDERLALFLPQHEGLRNIARLNLAEGTRLALAASLERYTRRTALLDDAKAALETLRADGHPELPRHEVDPAAFRDLQEHAAGLIAACDVLSARR